MADMLSYAPHPVSRAQERPDSVLASPEDAPHGGLKITADRTTAAGDKVTIDKVGQLPMTGNDSYSGDAAETSIEPTLMVGTSLSQGHATSLTSAAIGEGTDAATLESSAVVATDDHAEDSPEYEIPSADMAPPSVNRQEDLDEDRGQGEVEDALEHDAGMTNSGSLEALSVAASEVAISDDVDVEGGSVGVSGVVESRTPSEALSEECMSGVDDEAYSTDVPHATTSQQASFTSEIAVKAAAETALEKSHTTGTVASTATTDQCRALENDSGSATMTPDKHPSREAGEAAESLETVGSIGDPTGGTVEAMPGIQHGLPFETVSAEGSVAVSGDPTTAISTIPDVSLASTSEAAEGVVGRMAEASAVVADDTSKVAVTTRGEALASADMDAYALDARPASTLEIPSPGKDCSAGVSAEQCDAKGPLLEVLSWTTTSPSEMITPEVDATETPPGFFPSEEIEATPVIRSDSLQTEAASLSENLSADVEPGQSTSTSFLSVSMLPTGAEAEATTRGSEADSGKTATEGARHLLQHDNEAAPAEKETMTTTIDTKQFRSTPGVDGDSAAVKAVPSTRGDAAAEEQGPTVETDAAGGESVGSVVDGRASMSHHNAANAEEATAAALCTEVLYPQTCPTFALPYITEEELEAVCTVADGGRGATPLRASSSGNTFSETLMAEADTEQESTGFTPVDDKATTSDGMGNGAAVETSELCDVETADAPTCAVREAGDRDVREHHATSEYSALDPSDHTDIDLGETSPDDREVLEDAVWEECPATGDRGRADGEDKSADSHDSSVGGKEEGSTKETSTEESERARKEADTADRRGSGEERHARSGQDTVEGGREGNIGDTLTDETGASEATVGHSVSASVRRGQQDSGVGREGELETSGVEVEEEELTLETVSLGNDIVTAYPAATVREDGSDDASRIEHQHVAVEGDHDKDAGRALPGETGFSECTVEVPSLAAIEGENEDEGSIERQRQQPDVEDEQGNDAAETSMDTAAPSADTDREAETTLAGERERSAVDRKVECPSSTVEGDLQDDVEDAPFEVAEVSESVFAQGQPADVEGQQGGEYHDGVERHDSIVEVQHEDSSGEPSLRETNDPENVRGGTRQTAATEQEGVGRQDSGESQQSTVEVEVENSADGASLDAVDVSNYGVKTADLVLPTEGGGNEDNDTVERPQHAVDGEAQVSGPSRLEIIGPVGVPDGGMYARVERGSEEGETPLDKIVREFNAWVASLDLPVRKIQAEVVGGGMRVGAVAIEPLEEGEPYASVPDAFVMDSPKVSVGRVEVDGGGQGKLGYYSLPLTSSILWDTSEFVQAARGSSTKIIP